MSEALRHRRVPLSPSMVAALTFALCLSAPARALDILGLYVGAAVGQGEVSTGAPGFSAAQFRENHSAYKLMAGVRPISLLGAEVAYLDFGHPGGNLGGGAADATITGTAAFGLVYLPLPLPFLDLYGKAGVARLTSTVNGTAPVIGAFHAKATDSGFAAGLGAQLKFGDFAVRAEYERFSVAGGTPGLLSAGLTWTFF